jgi:hypothetical protein
MMSQLGHRKGDEAGEAHSWTPAFSVVGWLGWTGNLLVLVNALYGRLTANPLLQVHPHGDLVGVFAYASMWGMLAWLLLAVTTLGGRAQFAGHRRQLTICFVTLLASFLAFAGSQGPA